MVVREGEVFEPPALSCANLSLWQSHARDIRQHSWFDDAFISRIYTWAVERWISNVKKYVNLLISDRKMLSGGVSGQVVSVVISSKFSFYTTPVRANIFIKNNIFVIFQPFSSSSVILLKFTMLNLNNKLCKFVFRLMHVFLSIPSSWCTRNTGLGLVFERNWVIPST